MRPTAIVMAKCPAHGNVKTRLASDGVLAPETIREIAWALLRCTVHRLDQELDVVVAVSPDGAGPVLRERLERPALKITDQGAGSLGERMDRVWTGVRAEGPVAFFGTDSPDAPVETLRELGAILQRADVAIGPTGDGGYWTLAAGRHQPHLLHQIDWGTSTVYDSTCRRAEAKGLRVQPLPAWHDVDHRADLEALRRRLPEPGARPLADHQRPLLELAERLDTLL